MATPAGTSASPSTIDIQGVMRCTVTEAWLIAMPAAPNTTTKPAATAAATRTALATRRVTLAAVPSVAPSVPRKNDR